MFHVPVDHAQNPYFSTMVMKFQKKSTVNIRVRIGLHNALLVVMATINTWEDLWRRLQNQKPCDREYETISNVHPCMDFITEDIVMIYMYSFLLDFHQNARLVSVPNSGRAASS